jgi:DNA-binding transcriptional MerR regulator
MAAMHGDGTRYSIGELAHRTGLSVRTVRFYSDSGVVPPAGRTEAGYRVYDAEALARLELVRTLRELGIDLATIRRVLAREQRVPEVAAAHAAALDAQIRTLRLRRAVLRVIAARGSDPEEMRQMHRLAHLSDEERRRIADDFLDEVFDGLDIGPGFAARMRAGRPELPDDPTPEQVDAWIELAELVRDEDFRRRIRQMSERHAADRAAGTQTGDPAAFQRVAALVAERAGAALEAGIDPASDEARPIAGELAAAFAEAEGRGEERAPPTPPAPPAALADRLATGTDARAERYWQLLAVINGWPPVPTTVPAWEWLIAALRAREA